jgi:hypothetical protein
MPSSGILHRVTLVVTDVSEERSVSNVRVTRDGGIGITLGVSSNGSTLRRNTFLPIHVTLTMEAIYSSETSVLTRARQHHIPNGSILQLLPRSYDHRSDLHPLCAHRGNHRTRGRVVPVWTVDSACLPGPKLNWTYVCERLIVSYHTLITARALDGHANICGAERSLNAISAGFCRHSNNFTSHLQ